MIAAISLIFIVFLSMLVTKVATIALAHTGLSSEVARFQARSALTGAGFTTVESEKVTGHPVRRKIIFLLMLIGNAGLVTAVSSLMLTFVNPNTTDSLLFSVLIIVVGVSLLWWVGRSQFVDRIISRIIDRALARFTSLNIKDYAALLHLEEHYQIIDLHVAADDWIANKKLDESELSEEGLNVLGIRKKDGLYVGSPDGNTVIEPRDVLTVYGKDTSFEDLKSREQGRRGDRAHEKAVEKQEAQKL